MKSINKSERMFRLIFYPGVIVHEFSHALACLFTGTKIKKISFGLKESYVKHEATGPIRMTLIALAPFYLGFLLGVIFFYLGRMNIGSLIIFLFYNYLGLSILYYSIPSSQDTKNINHALTTQIKKDWKKGFWRKILVIFKMIFMYFPLYLLGQIVRIFDKSEIITTAYVLMIFALMYGLL